MTDHVGPALIGQKAPSQPSFRKLSGGLLHLFVAGCEQYSALSDFSPPLLPSVECSKRDPLLSTWLLNTTEKKGYVHLGFATLSKIIISTSLISMKYIIYRKVVIDH